MVCVSGDGCVVCVCEDGYAVGMDVDLLKEPYCMAWLINVMNKGMPKVCLTLAFTKNRYSHGHSLGTILSVAFATSCHHV